MEEEPKSSIFTDSVGFVLDLSGVAGRGEVIEGRSPEEAES